MTDSDSDHRVNRRRFLHASSLTGATLASSGVVSATRRDTCHVVQVGLDADVHFPRSGEYAPITYHNDALPQYVVRDSTLELADHSAISLKALLEHADRVVDADHYEQFPATVQTAAPATFIPITTNRDFRPTEVLELDSEYRPPAVELAANGTTVTATVGDSTVTLDAGAERALPVESVTSAIDVTERQGEEVVTVQQEAEIQPSVTIRNWGELAIKLP